MESGRNQDATEDLVASGGVMFRASAPIVGADRTVVGAVVVSRHLDVNLEGDARLVHDAYDRFKGLSVFQRSDSGQLPQSIFLAASLLILIAATWLGLYLAKRITRPVQQLAEGARAIGAGHLDVRLEAETGDELGSLVEAFNMMAAELQTNRSKLDQSRTDLERKNAEVDGRRRYIETVLERVATGVISLDADRSHLHDERRRAAAAGRRCDRASASRRGTCSSREDLRPLLPLVDAVEKRAERGIVQEITLAREGREINLATAATVLAGDGGVRGRGARARRRDAADSRAARRGLARRRAPARARNQEPADAHPAERRAHAAAFRRRAGRRRRRWSANAPTPSSRKSKR